MKNYKNSDYAANKYSDGIVYKFSDGTHEITMDEFLASDPKLTERDFHRWKRLSRLKYYHQARNDNAQTKKNQSIHTVENTDCLHEASVEENYIDTCDKQYAREALAWVLRNNIFTPTQYRRFASHFIAGLSLREIAKQENVHFTSVQESIAAATAKIKKHFTSF